ncbi:hypothetical protein AB0F23_00070, partial [Streptomyces sp. NPDC029003]
MPPSDDAQGASWWNSQLQRWEWGPRPAPDHQPPPTPPDAPPAPGARPPGEPGTPEAAGEPGLP